MFAKILIANRGEIACRVIRTARRLGIRTVAVYSEVDAGALHVASADEAVLIGPAPARESYLSIAKIIAAAKGSGAEAIHPGYGFLSENAAFAEACAAAGLVFIGPPVKAIRAMGSKSEAKAIIAKAGVPLVPGYHGADQADALLQKEAKGIGYPVLIKASAGGGGKGMRRVEAEAEFAAALAGARREAKAAFGDERMLIERYVERPRHVEIQVFADNHGHALHLFERDCSIQRRHQKVIEEAPAPGMTPERRRAMGEAAVAAARAIGYSGAGTVEFLLAADGAFYFMEMNTRLQVEHPVTEMITGLDLVEWQLRVAAGEELPLEQEQVRCSGHAFEARLYAEDPAKGFLPATGRIQHLRWPPADAGTRIDTGIRQGDEISLHYDPMLAKLIVWGEDRAIALRRFQAALAGCQVAGVANNIAFLARVAGHPAFAAGEVDTHFIERCTAALLPPPAPVSDRVLVLATLGELLHRTAAARVAAARSADPWSPWHLTTGWRLNLEGHDVLRFQDGATMHAVTIHYRGDGYCLDLPGGPVSARGTLSGEGDLRADLDGRQTSATILRDETSLTVFIDGAAHRLVLHDPLAQAAKAEAGPARLAAPMPGKVIQVAVKPGDQVKRGAALIVLEAMKMEHSIAAPADGTVAKVHYRVGDLVEEGAELLSFAETEAKAAS